MATQYGVTPQGFVLKPQSEILAEISTLLELVFGATIVLDPAAPFGQLASVLTDREASIWKALQAVYTARDPDGAEGIGLVELCGITGTIPVTPSPSTVTATLTGSGGTLVPAGSVVQVIITGIQYQTTVDATIVNLTAWAGTSTYVIGDRRTNGGNVYICATPGVSASSGGPSGTGSGIADGSGGLTWNFVGVGTGAVDAVCDSVQIGPQQALAGTLTVIYTPVSGWQGVNNFLDYLPGLGIETDSALRIRRIAELSANGSANVDAIQGALDALKDANDEALLSAARVFANDGDTTDSFGLLPHSIQALVQYPGEPVASIDQAVAQTIFVKKTAGIMTNGAQSKTVTSQSGQVFTIKFDYPAGLWIWMAVALTFDPNTYGGDANVKTAVVSFADGLIPPDPAFPIGGVDGFVFASRFAQVIFDNVSGVLDCTVTIGSSTVGGGMPSLGSSPVAVARNQLPEFDSTRISVTSTPVS